mgnify:CR=1 FL=1
MSTSWDAVLQAVKDRLKSNITYANVEIIGGIQEYLSGATGQAFNSREFLILLSHPAGGSQSNEPMLSGLHRKRYDIYVAIMVKTDPTTVKRMSGVSAKKGVYEVQDEIFSLLEHDNLGGLVDNKAGTNFKVCSSLIGRQ